MRQKLTHIALGTIILSGHFLLAVNLCVSTSDATHIAFDSERDGNAEIYIMDIKEKNLQNLTNHPARDVQPAFSPDGRWMAYVSDRDGNSRIYLMNRNKNEIRPLTNHLASTGDLDPNWSPNGQWIAYELEVESPWGNPNRDPNIHLVSPDGIETRQLTKHPARDRYPAWVPEDFLSVSPTVSTQTTLWGTLKKSGSD